MSDENPRNKLVGSPEWEKIRLSLKGGPWKKEPEWCCSQLRKYLGAIDSTSKDKIMVVQNYLVGSAFRMGKIKHTCITKLRAELSMERKKRQAKNEW